ncbi:beta-ketoacyl synthase N-terminal-like domain-containing protein [Pontibacter qinzhouensis]|uniref:beta-ketoacyl synthase N-terminal-like domain-containing protein n=1 Tax=Pontibacter qinzhouensis TaxID=2603253 RepID=UPI002106FD6D|nr:beta-ketoacyl synthase N-terminal-like domain-containing protein [Pontibacter qinzhouensis]
MSYKEHILIRGYGAVSALGHNQTTLADSFQKAEPAFQVRAFNGAETAVGALQPAADELLARLAHEKKAYQSLDRTVLLAMYVSRQAVKQAGWEQQKDIAVNIGSSRGATGLFEKYVQEFQQTGVVPVQTSPVTTLGNISSWVAQDLGSSGATLSHSVTCSTGIQAIANAFAWLKAGMATRFLAGAAEAPLTPFTIAQMKAIGIYSTTTGHYPCRPLNSEKQNTFVLGEGAAVFALEKVADHQVHQAALPAAVLESVGFGFEAITSKTGISRDGANFKQAVQEAIEKSGNTEPVDLVIMHAPGTVAGDSAEWQALVSLFGKETMPAVTSTKWLTGHTYGASACLSLAYALQVLQEQRVPAFPYPTRFSGGKAPSHIKRILITAAGFGGNAAALLVRKI